MLSVIDTLKETLRLWGRNFWCLLILTLVGSLPVFGIRYFRYSIEYSSAVVLLKSLEMFVGAFLSILEVAFILGLMRVEACGENEWRSIWSTIKNSASPILGAYLIFFGITVVIGFTCLFITQLWEMTELLDAPFFLLAMLPITCCVLFKYALAGPIIVMENMGPWSGMCRSWQMTRGHFWYVGGNFLFLGSAMWLMSYLLHTYVHYDDGVMLAIFLIFNQICATFGQALVILCWCMYQRIKALEPEMKIGEVSAN